MEKRVETNANQKIISTKLSTNYSILFQECKLVGILIESPTENTLYYFNPEGNQPKVTNEILEDALRAFISSNLAGLDLFYVGLYGLKQQEEYHAIAIKVFKEHWNKLYNMAIADDVFGRENSSFEEINKTYDFFAKK